MSKIEIALISYANSYKTASAKFDGRHLAVRRAGYYDKVIRQLTQSGLDKITAQSFALKLLKELTS